MRTKTKELSIATFCLAGFVLGLMAALLTGCDSEPRVTVSGVVKDAATGQPISGANVSDDGYGPNPYNNGAVTDSAGKYSYVTWPEEHGVIAQAPGYKYQSQRLTTGFLQREKEKTIDFALVRE